MLLIGSLPIIVGFGGINPAGRSTNHHGYRRLVYGALSESAQQQTLASIAALTGKLKPSASGWANEHGHVVDPDSYLTAPSEELLGNTLIRELEGNLFDPDRIYHQSQANLSAADDRPLSFRIKTKNISSPVPSNWSVDKHDEKFSVVTIAGYLEVMRPEYRKSQINSAGQLPSGFIPGELSASRNHPRGLQLSVFAACDALNSVGIDWDTVRQRVAPDQISVYAGSGLGQLDYHGNGGLLQARQLGKNVSSKQIALGYAEMPADFINAYLLGNLGTTGTSVAACATFLYNLRWGIKDI